MEAAGTGLVKCAEDSSKGLLNITVDKAILTRVLGKVLVLIIFNLKLFLRFKLKAPGTEFVKCPRDNSWGFLNISVDMMIRERGLGRCLR